MNSACPDMPFPGEMDLISLNYQGEDIRGTGPYAGLPGISMSPLYFPFHDAFPDQLIVSSETAARMSTRGTYFFPVTNWTSAPANAMVVGGGADATLAEVSDYGLYVHGAVRLVPRQRSSPRRTTRPSWPASSSGPGGTISASRRPSTTRGAHTLALST